MKLDAETLERARPDIYECYLVARLGQMSRKEFYVDAAQKIQRNKPDAILTKIFPYLD